MLPICLEKCKIMCSSASICRRCHSISKPFSSAVVAGTVITTIARGGSLHATVSLINIYKEGNLAIQQAGKNMSAKVVVVCKQCPLLRRGEQGGRLEACRGGGRGRGHDDLCMPWLLGKMSQGSGTEGRPWRQAGVGSDPSSGDVDEDEG